MDSTSSTSMKAGRGRFAWVLLVIIVGVIAGAVIMPLLPPPHGPPPRPSEGLAGSQNLGRVASVLSAVDLALLVALIVVYIRTYIDTKARFALGLVVFLVALTAHSVTGSPPVIGAFGFGWAGLGAFYFLSTLFEAVALTAFLYLSLE